MSSATLNWQAQNVLFILRVLCTYMGHTLSDEQLIEQFNALPPPSFVASPIGQTAPTSGQSGPTSPTSPTGSRPGQPSGSGAMMGKLMAGQTAGQPAVLAQVQMYSSRADPFIPYEASMLSTALEILVDVPLKSASFPSPPPFFRTLPLPAPKNSKFAIELKNCERITIIHSTNFVH